MPVTSPKAALPPRETAYDGLLFAATITLGSFLVFQVQPLIGRFILPWFGSSPGVWTTCMLFFQALLLAGYAYAHVLSVRLSPRAQTLLHIALLLAAALTLPITPSAAFKPTDATDPSARILLLLLVSVGAPYLLLASGAPLVQRWYARARPSASPYRLYSLSNIGSLLALLSYPLVFERLWSLETQTTSWSWAFIAYGLLCTLCALRSRRREAPQRRAPASSAIPIEDMSANAARAPMKPTPPPPVAASPAREQDLARVPWRDLALWVALSACGSVMLLAATNQICLDIAVTPMLWVVPLALYLLSFVICFDNERWYSRPLFAGLFVLALALVGPTILLGPELGIAWQLLVHCAALFTACTLCHGELYRLRPPPRRLTLFYLAVAAGGCLGGLLVALVAPRVFTGYYEDSPPKTWSRGHLPAVRRFRHFRPRDQGFGDSSRVRVRWLEDAGSCGKFGTWGAHRASTSGPWRELEATRLPVAAVAGVIERSGVEALAVEAPHPRVPHSRQPRVHRCRPRSKAREEAKRCTNALARTSAPERLRRNAHANEPLRARSRS